MDGKEVIDRIRLGESRNQELKGSVSWKDITVQFKITKSILSMSNIRDGGAIVLGAKDNKDGTYEPEGMTEDDFKSFNHDDVSDHVAKYADPYAKFYLQKIEQEGRRFVAIAVEQFDNVPVVCKKAYHVNDKLDLKEGDICTRTRRKPESSKVTSSNDLREIVDLATDLGVTKFERLRQSVEQAQREIVSDEDRFSKQLEGLL